MDIIEEQLLSLQKQVEDMTLDLAVHKALILGLMSELDLGTLQDFSAFRRVTQRELDKLPLQSDEQFHFKSSLNQFLKRAISESSADMNI
ncbi:TPA: hypothetical protein SMG11_000408 [Serratia marcescens]|uniref:hypothetical protein n=1 Tax=Serratia TaxID=613 RepID=UPI000667E10F|nr:hypothetical protein [Serratia marcescens]MBH2690111.1 hypothetical protein [Serratia marcescens]MBH2737804.1 hypothetical protein [Serratia marcescens]MBH2829545.1 hypothetical protein [Serratia marcescens]MBH3223446.1 hypothetical protein [Serratia marcescens]QVV71876.1 hypothetical protein KJB23_02540 [Serratia marcescens]